MTNPTQTAALLAWYDTAARELPWRGETDPYRIWVSEIMLQQTQVETSSHTMPAGSHASRPWPTLAPPSWTMLACWQGLGYYRRARSLLAAAKQVAAEHGGRLPQEVAALRRLAGIGDYTAGAIASIAFGTATPAIDGNVVRVISRLAAIDGDPASGPARQAVRAKVLALLPPTRPGDFNQALMELGATVCTPQRPACGGCPLQPACLACAGDAAEQYPRRPQAAPPRDRLHVAAVIRGEAGWLVGRRPPAGRWGGLWELPRVELAPDDEPADGLRVGLAESLGVVAEVLAGRPRCATRSAVNGSNCRLDGAAARRHGRRRLRALQWTAAFDSMAMSGGAAQVAAGAGLDEGG